MLRHLQQLPQKSFTVAPGDVIGGLIYVMDKPLGIEEGMVGISIDSPPYREFVNNYCTILEQLRKNEKQLSDFDQKQYPNLKQLSARYNKLYQINHGFHGMTQNEITDLILKDKVHVQKRHGASWKEFKNVFFSFSKYHEMKGWRSYVVNRGMGGMLFDNYKTKCNISKRDHFATHIGKLINENNKVYMIKQDGKMALGGTGPGWQKMLKTNTGKSLQKLVNPFVILATGGLSALVFGVAMLAWRGFYLRKNKPAVSNSEAIIESLSTKMASKRGISSQEIDTIQGTYSNGTPKVATIVTWAPGCRDLSDKLKGSNDWSSVIVSWDKNDQPMKVDRDGNIIRTNQKNEKGKIVSYEKVLKDGKIVQATAQEYNQAKAVSEHRISGLGESLISFISMGDRDGIGKAGQNKAIMPLKPPQDGKLYQFFGIDFGKSYKQANPIIHTLRDDFSFDNPTSRQSRFVNYSIMYDNPLREKMKGVYLLAALRGKLTPEMKEAIASDYASNKDVHFANKLRDYPDSVGGLNSDIKLIQDEFDKYTLLANDLNLSDAQRREYQTYANKLREMKQNAYGTDQVILNTFEKRLALTPSQIDILDNLEKLTAKATSTASPDGTVMLNHIRVERKDRCAWQLSKTPEGTFQLECQESENLQEIQAKLQHCNIPEVQSILQKATVIANKLQIPELTARDLKTLQKYLSEENVANELGLSYRSAAMCKDFQDRLRKSNPNSHWVHTRPRAMAQPDLSLEPSIEPLLSPRTQHMGYLFGRYHANDDLVHPVLAQVDIKIDTLRDRLQQPDMQMQYNIIQAQNRKLPFNKDQLLEIIFKDPDQNRECKVFAKQTETGVSYHFPKNLNEADFKLSADMLTKLAVGLSNSGHDLNIISKSDTERAVFDTALHEAEMQLQNLPQKCRDKPHKGMTL